MKLSFSPAQGPEGATILLTTDFNLPRLDFVHFNYTPTTFTLLSPTTIRTVTPVGFSSGRVTIGWYNFTLSSTAQFSRTYPNPVISDVTPSNIIVGASAIIVGSGFGEIDLVKFDGVSLPFVVNDVNQITVSIPSVVGMSAFTGPFTVITPTSTITSPNVSIQSLGFGRTPYGLVGYGY